MHIRCTVFFAPYVPSTSWSSLTISAWGSLLLEGVWFRCGYLASRMGSYIKDRIHTHGYVAGDARGAVRSVRRGDVGCCDA